jgi:hypothetical protein
LNHLLPFAGNFQIGRRRFLRLLHKTVQRIKVAAMKTDHHPCRRPVGQGRPHFEQSLPHRAHQRHADRPAVLHPLQVQSHLASIGDRQVDQPFSNGLITGSRPVEHQIDTGWLRHFHPAANMNYIWCTLSSRGMYRQRVYPRKQTKP